VLDDSLAWGQNCGLTLSASKTVAVLFYPGKNKHSWIKRKKELAYKARKRWLETIF
jgi:hypothetical protein